jgi:hypothetical protein
MVFTMTHLRIYGKKTNFQELPIIQNIISKIGFHGICLVSAVFIINNFNAWRTKSETMDTKSFFRLSFNRSDKKPLP